MQVVYQFVIFNQEAFDYSYSDDYFPIYYSDSVYYTKSECEEAAQKWISKTVKTQLQGEDDPEAIEDYTKQYWFELKTLTLVEKPKKGSD